MSRMPFVLIEALSRRSTVTLRDIDRDCRKAPDNDREFFGDYLRISALLTRESDYNVGVSRFAALHGEENYSG